MQRVDLGYRTDGVYLTGVTFGRVRYPDASRAVGSIEDALARLRANPAVRAAEATDLPPMTGGDQDITAIPVGVTPAAGQPPSIWYRSVSARLFVLDANAIGCGTHIHRGRPKGCAARGIINEEAALKFWPGENPVGRVLASGRDAKAPRITIVGVLASAHHDGANQPFKTELFLPFAQFPSRGVTLILQPSRDLASLTSAVRQTLHEVDPLLPVTPLEPLAARAGKCSRAPTSPCDTG